MQTFKAVLLSAKHYYNDLNPDICSLIAIHLVLLAAAGPSDLFIAFHNVAAASGPTRPRRPVLSLFIFMYGAEYYL